MSEKQPKPAGLSSKTSIVSGKVAYPGVYNAVNLNGWTLASEETPASHRSVLLGYRVPHLPEVWFGVGFRDGSQCYWLGSRGLDPHYQELHVDQVVIWRAVEWPFEFNDQHRAHNDYLQYRYVLGEEKPAIDLAYRAVGLAERLARRCSNDAAAIDADLQAQVAELLEALSAVRKAPNGLGWIGPQKDAAQ